MKDKTIIVISSICSLLGLILLFLLLPDYEETEIKKVTRGDVYVKGEVISQETGKVSVITLSQPDTIDVVFFEKVNCSGFAKAYGRVEEYKGKKQIIGHKIICE